jgi:uncharacterized protein
MAKQHEDEVVVQQGPHLDIDRRSLLKMTGTGVAALGIMSVIDTPFAKAQDMSNGADNFYKSDKLVAQKVSFDNLYKMKVVGNLYILKGLDQTSKHPAIVVGHPMGAVKEQTANLYAQKMAELGFVTMSLDLSFWGESAGEPRQAVLPDVFAEDFSAAVDFLGTRPFVDRNRIGVLGICASGRFVISAAKLDPRMRAVATVSMYDMGAATRDGIRHSTTLEQRKQMLAAAAEQRYVEFTGGKPVYVSGTTNHLTADTDPIQRQFYRFLSNAARRVHPRWRVARKHHKSNADQRRQVRELLPVRRHRDDLAASDAVHKRRSGPLTRIQRECLPARGRAEGALLGQGRWPRRSLRPREPDPVRQAPLLFCPASRGIAGRSIQARA